MDSKYFLVVDCNDSCKFPVEWNKIESDILCKIPSRYIYNRSAVNIDGDLVTKTVIYLKIIENEDINNESFIKYEDKENNIIVIKK